MGDNSFKSFEDLQFCRISRGSLYGLIDDLITSSDEGLISKEDYELGRNKISNALALLNGYINYLNRKANPQTNNQ